MKGLLLVLAALLCSACAPTLVDGLPGDGRAAARVAGGDALAMAVPVAAASRPAQG